MLQYLLRPRTCYFSGGCWLLVGSKGELWQIVFVFYSIAIPNPAPLLLPIRVYSTRHLFSWPPLQVGVACDTGMTRRKEKYAGDGGKLWPKKKKIRFYIDVTDGEKAAGAASSPFSS